MVESYYQLKNGCKKYNDCFTCPYPDCRADIRENNNGKQVMSQRHKAIIELANQGYKTKEIASKVGMTDRSVRRIRFLTRTS